MKQLSLKGLADFMTASATKQRSILRDHKYPSEDEARAKILYYREARDRIAAYHAGNRERQWLDEQSAEFAQLSASSSGGRRVRLSHNARALRQYAEYFSDRRYQVLRDINFELIFLDVRITVFPDLHVRVGDRELFLKLEFSTVQPEERVVKIISQCLFEAARARLPELPSTAVQYLDVPRGDSYRGARLGARLRRDIESTCQNISAIWDSI